MSIESFPLNFPFKIIVPVKYLYSLRIILISILFVACKKQERLPLVTTLNVSGVTPSNASCGGVIYSEGDKPVTERGVCWSTHPEPTIEDLHSSDGTGEGNFSSALTNLESNRTYYVRAYATSELGISYGKETLFATTVGFNGYMTDKDGNRYSTVVIGNQEWMAENLKVAHYRDGSVIPYRNVNYQWQNLSTSALCYYNDDPSFYNSEGYLYNWYAVMDSRNISPSGWHVPDINDWAQLIEYLGGSSVAGGKLKDNSGVWSNTSFANNSSGFFALPAGQRNGSGYFYNGGNSYHWCNTLNYAGSSISYVMGLENSSSRAVLTTRDVHYGFSVRLVKD